MPRFGRKLYVNDRVAVQGRQGRGDTGAWLQGQRVRAEEGELLVQWKLWLWHPGAHRLGHQVS